MPLNINDVESEIQSGFGNERGRLNDARDNRRFYEGCFDEYPTRLDGRGHARQDFRRTSRIMSRIVNTLCGYLYKKPPSRKVPNDPAGTETLARIYRANQMAARWMYADRMTVVGDFACLQFAGAGGDPATPVKIHLRDADQTIVWTDPDDETEAGAVGVIETADGRRTLRLWTPDEVRVYATDKRDVSLPGHQAGGTAYRRISAAANPYRATDGSGILPFSFAHFNFPATTFFSGGIGTFLRELNDALNYRLDSLGDAIRYLNRPIAIASGVSPGWSPPNEIKPGMWINLDADGSGIDANGAGPVGTLSYLVSDTGYISADWADLNFWIDRALEDCEIPPGSIRFAEAAASGIALVIRQGPLVSFAENRRMPFAQYEEDAAVKAFEVGASHLESQGGDGGPLRAAAEAVRAEGLLMAWPRLQVLPPGPERDQADQWELDTGVTSKIRIVMDRYDYSREQAIEHLSQVVDDNAELAKLGIDSGTAPPAPPLMPGEDPNAPPPAPAAAPPAKEL